MLKLVVFSFMMTATRASVMAPFAPLAYTAPVAYSPSLLAPYGSNYRGPLSLAPGQPANILAADGRPLDTLDVNLDRSAHYTAKALERGVHFLKKRSVGLIAPLTYSAPILAPFGHNYRGPLSLFPGQPANILAADGRPLDTLDVNQDRSAHFTAKALSSGIHYLKKRSVPMIASVGHVVASPLVHRVPLAYSTPVLGSHLAVAPVAYDAAPFAHYTHW